MSTSGRRKKSFAQNRKPYVFVNFSDWRGQAVKLTIWVDGMDAIKPNVPDESWIGRWVSVTGLVDPPYSGSVGYTHLSITITAPGQIQQLPERDARFRLAVAGKPTGNSVSPTITRNANILQGMGGKPAGSVAPIPPLTPPTTRGQSRNQQVLTGMQRQAPSTAHTPARNVPTGSSKSSSSGNGCLSVVVVGAFLWLLVKAFVG